MKRLLCCVIALSAATIFASVIATNTEATATSPGRDELVAKSERVLRERRMSRGDREDDLVLTKVTKDERKKTHSRFRQNVNGIPVWGGEAIVHLNEDGSVDSVTDNFKNGVRVDPKVRLTAADALSSARKAFPGSGSITSEPTTDVWIYRGEDRDHVAYRVQFERLDQSKDTGMPVYFIDAQSGEVVFQYDNFQTASGRSQYSGDVQFDTVLYRRGNYQLEDLGRMMGTFDFQNSSFGGLPQGRFSDTDNNWISGGVQSAGIDAHWNATQVYDYYNTQFGRNGIDGNGGPGVVASITGKRKKLLTSGVHYGWQYSNAGWTGSYMVYGDGDGVTSASLTTLDIAGHEFTHGVTQYEANLIYSGESGALNEGISDIFGALIESRSKGLTANTWKIGEECWTPATAGDALRYMDEPHRASNNGFTVDDDPDHYSEIYRGSGDNGGVHINSGVVNKQFYLLANGGTHHLGGSMTGIGMAPAAKIWYQALTNYMTSSTDFAGARVATINAANSLYGAGSTESLAVERAWTMVGVF